MFEEADLIHRYTRADALRDGILIDVSVTAQETASSLTSHRVPASSSSPGPGGAARSATASRKLREPHVGPEPRPPCPVPQLALGLKQQQAGGPGVYQPGT
jgi:hypothetical protein